jgi:hypothetical protein
MASESIDLKEVVIDENSQISAENLYYTLWTKEIFTCGAQIIYGTFRSFRSGIDYRTKSNAEKKEVIVEYKEQMLIKLDYLLPEYYTQTLKILKNTYGDFNIIVLKTPI